MKKLSALALLTSLLLTGCSKKIEDPKSALLSPTIAASVVYSTSSNTNTSATVSLLNDTTPNTINWSNFTPNTGAFNASKDFASVTRSQTLRMSVIYQDIYKRADGTISRTGTGTIHADLLIDGVVRGTIDMDAAQPSFDAGGTFKKTITVVAQ